MDEKEKQLIIHEGQVIVHWQKLLLSTLSVLVTISLFLSGYIFTTIDTRLARLEVIMVEKGEKIAILEQQARENSAAHTRIEAKVDTLLAIAMNSKK